MALFASVCAKAGQECVNRMWGTAYLEDGTGNDAAALASLAALHGVGLPGTRLPVTKQAHLTTHTHTRASVHPFV